MSEISAPFPGFPGVSFSITPAHQRAIRAAYATPGRPYHTFAHAAEVVGNAAASETPWQRPGEVWLAALYHDAVYVPGRGDNEAASASLARAHLDRWPLPVDRDRVEQLILLTLAHGHLDPGDVDPEAARFLDADMAILAAPPATFDAYDAAVEAEWASLISPEAWRAGRLSFVSKLLARPRIFLSEPMHAGADAPARANLRRLADRLGG